MLGRHFHRNLVVKELSCRSILVVQGCLVDAYVRLRRSVDECACNSMRV